VSPRRRGVILGGLALLLGGLAASDVAGREAALRRGLGAPVPVVVARRDVLAGARIAAHDLAVRRVPARYAPAGAIADPREVEGLRAAVAIAAGADLDAALLEDGAHPAPGAPVRPGERLAELVVAGAAAGVGPGARVDVLVTRDGHGAAAGRTVLALEDVEVVGAAPATAAADEPAGGAGHVALTLRVTVRQAVYLAAAQAFAREVRVLPRAAGDRRRGAAGLSIGEDL
jgi:pilus assembly protein CpaB